MEKEKRQGVHPQNQAGSPFSQETVPVSRELANKRKRVIDRRKALRGMIDTSSKEWESALTAHNRDMTSIAYRGEPFIYDYLNARREMHSLRPTAQALYQQGSVIKGINPSSLEKEDLFIQKLKGLSFMDIENMEADPQTHELAPEDIRRINRMFRANVFSRFAKDKSVPFAVESLIYFASQQWTHPEIGVPRSLKKFHENITAYFEYYTSFLTDFKRDPWNEFTMLFMLGFGKGSLTTAVGTYSVARLNITPSSAIKLYKQREALADINLRLLWKQLEKAFLPVFKEAYRENALPEDLKEYQHYNEDTDSTAANILQDYLQEASSTEEQFQKRDEATSLMEQWNKHKRDVVREMRQQRLEYQISQNPAEKVTMIRNRDTFIFIMHFPDNVHLTLEIDKTGRLFGVPPSLLKRYPHVSDTFIIDLLTPLLEKYKVKDVLDKNKQDSIPQISTTSLEPPIANDFETSREVSQEEDQAIKPPKRKRLIPALTIFESDPLPPVTPLAPKVERFVAYSEDRIKELLGPQVSRQQAIVDQTLRAIDNFEHGYIRGWRLRGEYSGITRIRAGDHRIFMHDLGNGNYSISQIVRRSGAYQPRA